MSFVNKVCIVTGGTSGVGSAICRRLASSGCYVVLTYHTARAKAEELLRELGGDRASAQQLDVTEESQVRLLFRQVVDRFGGLDLLVNNASYSARELWNIEPDAMLLADWEQCIAVDLTGSFLCCKYAIPAMRRRGRGRILFFSSSGSLRGDTNTFAYNSAKVGVVGLMKSIARACAPAITANAIAPGSIDSGWMESWKLSPGERDSLQAVREMSRRVGTVEEAASLAAFLLSDESSYINGQTILLDGGLSA
jgi:NAD(P)-dependent dehydrogenase (short-subunit alcohol dehydrogenase family)